MLPSLTEGLKWFPSPPVISSLDPADFPPSTRYLLPRVLCTDPCLSLPHDWEVCEDGVCLFTHVCTPLPHSDQHLISQ